MAILKREQRGMQQSGEEILRDFFNKEGLEFTPDNIQKLCTFHNLRTQEELFSAIGFKTIIPGDNDKNELKDKPATSNWKKNFIFLLSVATRVIRISPKKRADTKD